MKADLIKSMPYAEMQKAYAAYITLREVYEVSCGGIYAAREHKEYFSICGSIENIQREVLKRSNHYNHGDEQQR